VIYALLNRWILSKAKKDNVDEAVSKYDGEYWTYKPGFIGNAVIT